MGVSVNDLMLLKIKKLTAEDYTGHGKNTWFTEERC
jgi:TfoX/Sxy family transcriptional regulator of competence genes